MVADLCVTIDFLEAASMEISGRGYRFYLGFDGEEEWFIFTVDAGEISRTSIYSWHS